MKDTAMSKVATLRAEDGSIKRYPVPAGFRPNPNGYDIDGKVYHVIAVLSATDPDSPNGNPLPYTHPGKCAIGHTQVVRFEQDGTITNVGKAPEGHDFYGHMRRTQKPMPKDITIVDAAAPRRTE